MPVFGDQLFEPDEAFLVKLTSPVGAVLGRDVGTALIPNDDPKIGEGVLAPPAVIVPVGERVTLALTWTHPERWRILETIDIRIVDDAGAILWVRFHEPSNTFSLFNPSSRRFGHPATPGDPRRFETSAAIMYLSDSIVVGTGPTGPSVTLNLAVGFKPRASGHAYRVEVFAVDDFGHEQGFDPVGTIEVQPAQRRAGDSGKP